MASTISRPHLWSVLEIQVGHRLPLSSSLKELEGILTEVWVTIRLETIHKLYESITWRNVAVISIRDRQTPY